MIKTTFLTADQIWGDSALDVIKEYGTKVGATDLVIALGGWMGSNATSDGLRTTYVWSSSDHSGGNVRAVDHDGDEAWTGHDERDLAARPALPKSSIRQISPSAARASATKSPGNKIEFRQFGEYPQDVAPDRISKELEHLFNAKNLRPTGNKYTFDAERYDAYDKPFKPYDLPEYAHNGKRYIRVRAFAQDNNSVLSNGRKIDTGDILWIEVAPIDWMVDSKTGIWIAHRALFAGVKFNDTKYDGNLDNTNMGRYMDKYFVPQMQQNSRVPDHANDNDGGVKSKFQDAKRQLDYNVQVIDEPLSTQDQIDFYIKNGMSFMLHGPSGVGKTARVEAIDPDLTAVPLWNGVLPEDIVGKVRYPNGAVGLPAEFLSELAKLEKELVKANPQIDTRNIPTEANIEIVNIRKILESQPKESGGGVWVAPDWYNELVRKCASAPNQQHVLFIDEVTNAKPTTQSLIFHIVLKKSISPSKGKLPANVVVVLAGNSREESGAAYNMPSPLFRRMTGHIYLELNLPDWLEWASEKSRKYPNDPKRLNVHPIISSFVALNGESVFYSEYNEEEPQRWAIDPRGWEQISDIIYNNNGIIRRELIENKIGRDNAAALLAYAKNPPLSLSEILSGNYSRQDIPEAQDARLALALSLRHADEKQIAAVREFIDEHLGPENRAILDSRWIGNNDERAIFLSQLDKARFNFIPKGKSNAGK